MPVESGRLDALPPLFASVESEVHDAHVGVQLGVKRPVGVMGDDRRDHLTRAPVGVLAAPPHAGRRQCFRFFERLSHGFLPPLSDPFVTADQMQH